MTDLEKKLTVPGIALAVLLVFSLPALAQQFDPDHLVVEMEEGYGVDVVNSQFGTTTAQYLGNLDVYLLNAPEGSDLLALAAEITELAEVKECTPNFFADPMQPVQGSLPISDGISSNDYLIQPAITTIDLPGAQAVSTGLGVKVAVLDGGVDYTHPAFGGSVVSGYDYIDQDGDAFDETGGANSGHGTFVAGVIHMVAPDAQIVAYRVSDTAGQADGYIVAEAILQALNDGCRVINISMVMYGEHAAIRGAIRHCYRNGCVTVVASGNGTDSIPRYPASDGTGISVAALDSESVLTDFSCYGTHIDVCAPGAEICSPFTDSSYAVWSGSSFAAPFVAGQAALIAAHEPGFSGFHVKSCIVGSGTDIDDLNPDYAGLLGAGLMNPLASFSYDPVVCGDVDGSGMLDISDAQELTYYLAGLEACGDTSHLVPDVSAPWLAAAPVDPLPGIDVGDFVYLMDFFYFGGPPPCATTELPVSASGGTVSLVSVEGAVGYQQLATQQPVSFYLEIDNNTEENLHHLSNGFSLTSPDGAAWDAVTVQAGETDVPLAAGEVYFALVDDDPILARLAPFTCHVSAADAFGAVSTAILGVPAGHGGTLFRISIGPFGPEDVGKTLVLDSAFFGNGGNWGWYPDAATPLLPEWGGPYTFTIVEPDYLPGDADNDSVVTLNDLTFMIDYLFRGGGTPEHVFACDVDGDCNCFNVADLTYLVAYLFKGGDQPLYGCSRADQW